MPDYSKAKIYKIYSYENDDVYYGSTINALSQRIAEHRCNYKRYKEGKTNYTTSFKILELVSCKIELVEDFPCENKEQLLQREGYYINNNNCVNYRIAGRTHKEWTEENKEYQKEYREANKDKSKKYRETHKEYYKEYHNEYYEQNKEQIKIYNKQYYQRKKEQQLMLNEDTNINKI